MSKPCPCDGCVPPKRNAECHSNCPDYAEWNAERQQELEMIRAIKATESDYESLRVKNYFRNHTRRKRR